MTKTHKIVYNVLRVLLTAIFLFTAYDKLSGDPMAKAGFAVAHLPVWFMYFIGVAELCGVIGIWTKLKNWAAAGLFIILAGAVVTTLIFVSAPMAILPVVVAIILAIFVWMGKKKNSSSMTPPAPVTTPTV